MQFTRELSFRSTTTSVILTAAATVVVVAAAAAAAESFVYDRRRGGVANNLRWAAGPVNVIHDRCCLAMMMVFLMLRPQST